PAQPGSSRATRVAHVSKAPLRALRSQPLKTPASLTTHAPAIGMEGVSPACGLVRPPAWPSFGSLGNVGPQIVGRTLREALRLVVALVCDDFLSEGIAPGTSDVLLRLAYALEQRLAVGSVRRVDRGRDDHLAVEVDHVLCLVGEVRAAVLHLRDPAGRIALGLPVLVGDPLLSLSIEPPRILLA